MIPIFFAKILKGEARADIVYENENVLCFNDIYPKAPVHVLVIPKRKFIDLSDFSENSKSEEKIDIFDAFSALVKKFGIIIAALWDGTFGFRNGSKSLFTDQIAIFVFLSFGKPSRTL